MRNGLTKEQKQAYETDGFVILRGLLSESECDAMIDHMMKLQSGATQLEGFAPREKDNWGRTHNQHFYDPKGLELLIHPKLRQPLADCYGGDAEGIQTMYFWKGSEQRRHQDQFYLPGCMSAWLALQDVGPSNGTIYVQPGSHKKHLLVKAELAERFGDSKEVTWGGQYNDCVDEIFEQNGVDEVAVQAAKGDVVLFHGVLIHRGGPIQDEGSFRHVLANHYIAYDDDEWPHLSWPRYSFDGVKRFHPAPPE